MASPVAPGSRSRFLIGLAILAPRDIRECPRPSPPPTASHTGKKHLKRSAVADAEGMLLTSSIRGCVRVSAYGARHFDEHPLFDAVRAIWLEEMARGDE